ncbi:efflux RND transporter periplasmic adaptor subunit [Dyella monticola]|uniref:Efflux RND transporter periplasmic adaptor subunit n=1 Tax=Dyella monticola TaxID=1927958 RepID=A0A370WYP4_9GAMM|nr:efflux RND transporter periplasmic adaptor subunit [Dyella monticola]RDS81117.1 efflux RND transporter periplasmic adaptor subunit [Dyella monticola]
MATQPKSRSSRSTLMLRLIPGAVVVLALGIGAAPRLIAHMAVNRQTQSLSEPTVAVVRPTAAPERRTIDLPGDVQAFQATRIYARTNGYLSHWYTDIGTQVQAGQLLATIDAPEVDAQLQQARADADTELADYRIAKITSDRWQQLLATNSVSRQSAQENLSAMQAKQAALAAANANVARLEQMQSYEKVYAPFAGTITRRNIDTGSLIDAGSNGGAPAALFDLAEIDRLRVFVDVPQDQAPEVVAGTTAQLSLPQYPGRLFSGVVARTSGAIDPVSRTLRVEVDVDNKNDAILPGAFAQVHLGLTNSRPGLSLPANALLFRPTGVEVAVVNDQGKVQLIPVVLGRDFGTRVEIRSGLRGYERVIVNPGDAISGGQSVRVSPTAVAST